MAKHKNKKKVILKTDKDVEAKIEETRQTDKSKPSKPTKQTGMYSWD